MMTFWLCIFLGGLVFAAGVILEQIHHAWAMSRAALRKHPCVTRAVEKLNQESGAWTLIDQDLWYNHDLGSIYIQKAFLDPITGGFTLWVDNFPLPFAAMTHIEQHELLAGLERVRDILGQREAQRVIAGLKSRKD